MCDTVQHLRRAFSNHSKRGVDWRALYLSLGAHPITLPGQWSGLGLGDSRPKKEPLATQVEEIEVEQRPLELYQVLVAAQD